MRDGGYTVNAVIRTGGKQYRIAPGDLLKIEKLEADEGSIITFDDVLLVEDGENISVGTPLVKDAVVKAKVIRTARDRKIIVFNPLIN